MWYRTWSDYNEILEDLERFRSRNEVLGESRTEQASKSDRRIRPLASIYPLSPSVWDQTSSPPAHDPSGHTHPLGDQTASQLDYGSPASGFSVRPSTASFPASKSSGWPHPLHIDQLPRPTLRPTSVRLRRPSSPVHQPVVRLAHWPAYPPNSVDVCLIALII